MIFICQFYPNKCVLGTSLVAQWLRLHTYNAGGMGLIREVRSRMPYGVAKKQKCVFKITLNFLNHVVKD